MIKKLRRRFILTTMLAVLLVLIVMMSTINILNYRTVVREADDTLSILADNEGELPGKPGGMPPEWREDDDGEMPDPPDDMEEGMFGDDDQFDEWMRRDEDDRGFFRRRSVFSEENLFEARFFTVLADENGTVTKISTENIGAVTSSEAKKFAEDVLRSSKTKGFEEDYRFLVTETEDGDRLVLFLDCAKSLDNTHTFLAASLLVSAGVFAVVLLLVILVSGRILKPVEESYVKQKSFITDAGHELKTPVAVIDADAAVLEMEIGENEWVDDIKKQTKRLAELTGELTYLARMDEGRTDTVKIEFPVSDVVEEMAQSYKARALVEEKTFSYTIEPMLSMTGDEAQIRKLTSILLDNAVKYSSEKGEIRLSLAKKNKNIVLSVYNTVDSVDPGTLAHMFDRFYRADKSRSNEKSGFGLGLSIAQSIVTAHKGKISAASAGENAIEITAVL